jgi:cysteinyl-tRNA synthetase
LEDLKKHRIEPDPTKRNPGDFSLWKKRQDGPEVTWDSPWGKGRPGWHIEDTAITENYFGAQYDIHGGAMDLIFPHHEAEIAQMEATSGKKPLVRFWMHTGFLNVNGEKMSKSLGNFTTIRDMLQKFDADSFRFFVLSSHYRSPIDFSESALDQSKKSLERIRQAAKAIEEELERTLPSAYDASSESEVTDAGMAESRAGFLDAMDNDFNTPYSLKAVFELVREVNRRINERSISKKSLIEAGQLLDDFGRILGISFSPALARQSESSGNNEDMTGNLIELLIDVRQKLRERKDWTLADEIRNRLNEQGIVLEDVKVGGGRYSIK